MIVFPLLTAIAVLLLLRAEHAKSERGIRITKPIASALFIATAIAAGAQDSAYGRVMVLALVLSALGDVLLIGKGKMFFLGGLGAFLMSHVAFVIAFTARGLSLPGTLVALPLTALFGWRIGAWLWPQVDEELRYPVAAYIGVICLMVACAVGTALVQPGLWIAIAAILFMFSDIFVAKDRLVKPAWSNRLWGLPLYYLAQIVFALSVVGAAAHPHLH